MAEIPLETIEQQALAWWLRARNYLFYKSPSETYTKSWTQKRKNKMEGVTKGFPDIVIVLKRGSLLFVELKRQRRKLQNGKLGASPSKVAPEQKEWCDTLNKIENVGACIAYGWEDAVKQIEYFENL